MPTSKATQSNTNPGGILPFVGSEDLSALSGHLAKLISSGGKPQLAAPTAITDHTPFLIIDGNAAGALSYVKPLNDPGNVRVVAKGAGAAGAVLVQANTATPADRGKVRALPATSGTYRGIGIAEEDFVEGQWVLMRPADIGNIVVP
jgi:hypothetical protein